MHKNVTKHSHNYTCIIKLFGEQTSIKVTPDFHVRRIQIPFATILDVTRKNFLAAKKEILLLWPMKTNSVAIGTQFCINSILSTGSRFEPNVLNEVSNPNIINTTKSIRRIMIFIFRIPYNENSAVFVELTKQRLNSR